VLDQGRLCGGLRRRVCSVFGFEGAAQGRVPKENINKVM